MRRAIVTEACILGILGVFIFMQARDVQKTGGTENHIWSEIDTGEGTEKTTDAATGDSVEKKDFIKWVDFQVASEALQKAMEIDIETYHSELHIPWTTLLAYRATQNGGKVTSKDVSAMEELAASIQSGEKSLDSLGGGSTYYDYYLESYEAALSGFLGEYEINGKTEYGLKAFHPIAKGFDFSDYDDFGVSRTYGFKRRHLGHDMMGLVGTPIIAVESGYVEVLGWNQYGGWRIGIRSFDKKRYYYYAHLRQNYPFAEGLQEGDAVTAGDVIGYMGHTGYSQEENVNNIETTHLHFGLELIFDESQKECDNEIWIDCYQLVRFLYQNRSEAAKVGDTKEWKRVQEMTDPAVEAYLEAEEGEKKKDK